MPAIKSTVTILMLASIISMFVLVTAYPHHGHDDIITVEEVIHDTAAATPKPELNATLIATTEESAAVTCLNGDNAIETNKAELDESTIDISDDLFFVSEGPQTEIDVLKEFKSKADQQRQPPTPAAPTLDQHQVKVPRLNYQQQMNLRKMAFPGHVKHVGDSLESAEDASNTSSDEEFDTELQAFKAKSPKLINPIDFSDLWALVPQSKVQAVVRHYQQNDAEVQRVFAYLTSTDFEKLRKEVTALPEIQLLLKFFSLDGLDIVGYVDKIVKLVHKAVDDLSQKETTTAEPGQTTTPMPEPMPTPVPILMAKTPVNTYEPIVATATEPANRHGLKGLVDSILMVLPQEQVLEKFFDKLENDKQFNKLVENLRTSLFNKILTKLQKSKGLQDFLAALHSNGINVLAIVDSFKDYFLVGGF